MSISAIVVGGGISGLAAARILALQGVDVTLIEQAAKFGAVGAGLQLSPNGSKILRSIGLGPGLDTVSVHPKFSMSFNGLTGDRLGQRSINEEPLTYGAPHELVYRPDLIDVLTGGVRSVNIVHGAMVEGFAQDADSVTVRTMGGSEYTADLLIGADGMHSTVREQLLGETRAIYTGKVAFRSIVPAEKVSPISSEAVSAKFWGPQHGHHFVMYPIENGRSYNITAVSPKAEWVEESWDLEGDVAEFKERYSMFASPVKEVMEAVTTVHEWALHVREPLPKWSDGRVTLIGDACHPMVPFLGQGAVMGIEDAAVLGKHLKHLSTSSDVPMLLQAYEDERKPRATFVQEASFKDDEKSWADREWLYGHEIEGYSRVNESVQQ